MGAAMYSITLRVFLLLVLATTLQFTTAASADDKHPAVVAAEKALKAAVDKAAEDYLARLDAAAKEVLSQGDLKAARAIEEKKQAMKAHGLSTVPDPTAKSKRILLANIFRVTDGAILDFRFDQTAYGRHNGKTTNWVMTDQQTLILGAVDPSRPLYIYKFDKSLSRGVVYKYQPLTTGKRHTVRRSGR